MLDDILLVIILVLIYMLGIRIHMIIKKKFIFFIKFYASALSDFSGRFKCHKSGRKLRRGTELAKFYLVGAFDVGGFSSFFLL